MQPTPPGWPRISSAVFYRDPRRAIEWLCQVFGFELRIKVEHAGELVHSELTFGGGVVMVSTEGPNAAHPEAAHWKSPSSLHGANTQSLLLYIDDLEAHCAHARALGAQITTEPRTADYGPGYWSDRCYEVQDLEGHRWWFCQRLKTY